MNATMKITGRTVLFGMIAFFGVIFAVNGVFLYVALDSFPGLTSDKAYVEGLEYNRTLADGERQDALGWTPSITISGANGVGQQLIVRITDRDGNDVPRLTVDARIERPATASGARDVELIPSATGHVAPLDGLAEGRWNVSITAKRDGETIYRIRDEVFVKP